MEGPGQTAAELTSNLPLPVSMPAAQIGDSDIEAEVMILFEEYRTPLLRYAVSFGVPVSDAEEIVQEVFVSLFLHLRLGKSRRNLRSWLFRVAHNLTLKRRHANKRLSDIVVNNPNIADAQSNQVPTPEESYSQSERQRRLLAVVQSLPVADQSCLRLRAEGLRYREIAGILGISLGSVSAFLTRSLAKLIRADRG